VPGDSLGYLEENGRYVFEGRALTDVEACTSIAANTTPMPHATPTSPQQRWAHWPQRSPRPAT
jgi:hypothetical protein